MPQCLKMLRLKISSCGAFHFVSFQNFETDRFHFFSDSYSNIDGSEERHVKAGSRLSLVCRVHESSGVDVVKLFTAESHGFS
jgi:hypothetical protein